MHVTFAFLYNVLADTFFWLFLAEMKKGITQ